MLILGVSIAQSVWGARCIRLASSDDWPTEPVTMSSAALQPQKELQHWCSGLLQPQPEKGSHPSQDWPEQRPPGRQSKSRL